MVAHELALNLADGTIRWSGPAAQQSHACRQSDPQDDLGEGSGGVGLSTPLVTESTTRFSNTRAASDSPA